MAWRLAGFDPLNHLGSGSTGAVMKARDWTSGLPVTIKYLSKDVAGTPGFAEQFREDAAVLVRIDNPHVAQVYGYIEEPQGSAVVTEFIDGLSLQTILENGGPLEPQSALYVLKGTLTGLAEAHRRNVTHRDMKPANLMIDKDGVTKVVDFGVAARYRRKAPAAGNPHYLAPELWVGRPATPASDVFAASAVLFEALTGAAPKSSTGDFLGREGLSASDASVTEPIASLPERVRTLVSHGLSAQPSTRFANADDMLDSLDLAALAGYGSDWEKVGKEALVARMLPLLSRRPAGVSPGRRVVGAFSRTFATVNKGALIGGVAAVLVAAAVVYVISSGAFDRGAAAQLPVAPPISHTPVPQIGPTIPTGPPSPVPGVVADRTKPQRPTGLHVTGRSQTAVSLDWNPSTDNVKVVGYAISRDGHRIATTYTPGYTAAQLTADTTYQFSVLAFDAAGNLSPASLPVTTTTLKQPDTTPPSVPTGLRSTSRTTTTIVLDWNPSHDDVGVAGYDVFRNKVKIATVTRTGFTDTRLSPATKYTYSVRAFDTTDNASNNTATISAMTLAVPDTTPPAPPQFVNATSTGTGSIEVTWSAATDNVGVASYNVIRVGTPGVLANTQGLVYDDSGLTANTTYTYQVVALDAAGNKSTTVTTSATTDQIPAVTSLVATAGGVSAGCTVQVTASLKAVGGLPSVNVTFSGPGVTTQTKEVDFNAAGNGSVSVTGDGTVDGNVTASVPGFSDKATWSAPAACIPVPPAVASVTFDTPVVLDAPDCTTTLTVHVHAVGGLASADVDFSGTGVGVGVTDQTVHVTFDGSGDATATISTGDGNVSGDVTASAGGQSDHTTWSPGSGCPVD